MQSSNYQRLKIRLNAIQEEYNNVFLDKEIIFDRMVFYEAGLSGTCKKVIDEINL